MKNSSHRDEYPAMQSNGPLPQVNYFLLVLFSFILANESTPLLLLLTFGSVFVRKCEQKQPTLIINCFLLVLFSFILANESTPLLLLFTFGFVFVRKCERKHSTLIYYIIYFWLCFRS